MKTCTGCKKEQVESNFYPSKITKDGLMYRCKECGRIKALSEKDKKVARRKELRRDPIYRAQELEKEKIRQGQPGVKEHIKKQQQGYRGTEGFALKQRSYMFKCRYGITLKEAEKILAYQQGGCAICRLPVFFGRGQAIQAAHIDHNHETDEVRGILCGNCNRGIGHFHDISDLLEAAARYIRNENGLDWASEAQLGYLS